MNIEILDRFNYRIPLGNFLINDNMYGNYIQNKNKESKSRPIVLKSLEAYNCEIRQIELNQTVVRSNQTKKQSKVNQKETYELAVKKMIFMSKEEIKDLEEWRLNSKRPIRQQFTYNHINLWWATKSQSQLDAKLQQGSYLWATYLVRLSSLAKPISELLFDEQLKQDQSLTYLLSRIKSDDKLFQQIKDEDTTSWPQLYNKELNELIYRGVWEQNMDVNYSDLYFLIHQFGIPDNYRCKVWRKLLKAQLSEFESISHFKQYFGEQLYNQNLTVFENYSAQCDRLDCLAFDQIDEDVKTFQFPEGYLSNLDTAEKQVKFYQERYALRKLLRVLIVWARQRKVNGFDLCLSYSRGMLDFIQRLLSISDQNTEDAFWIVSGLIQLFPRPFSVPESVLEGDCFSMMRAEMITFKALLEQHLPEVYGKIKTLGLTVESLVYKPILSFHANYFHSDIVLRLWDIMFLSFSSSDPQKQKTGMWYIFAPSYLVLREKSSQIVDALTCEEIIQTYESACCLTYDPDKFLRDIALVCEELFVEKTSNVQSNAILNYIRGSTSIHQANKKAAQYDRRRETLQKEIKSVFNKVRCQNKQINSYLQVSQPLKDVWLQNHLLKSIKEIVGNQVDLNQVKSEETELPLHSVHVFVHGLDRMPFKKQAYTVKLTLGAINSKTLIFNEVKDTGRLDNTKRSFLSEVQQTERVSSYQQFDYYPGFNFLKLELFEPVPNGKRISDAILSLEELEYNRFSFRRVILKNASVQEVPDNYLQSFTLMNISLYLQQRQMKQTQLLSIVQQFSRKEREVADVFEQVANKETNDKFVNMVLEDYKNLDTFLPRPISLGIINESYNYVEIEGFPQVTLEDFISLAQKILPTNICNVQSIKELFEQLMSYEGVSTSQKLNPELQNQVSLSKLFGYKDSKFNFGQLLYQNVGGVMASQSQFSLRQFLITTILMAHCTVSEKLSAIFDLFDFIQGQQNGSLQLSKIIELISYVFTRSMYLIPDHELINLVESIYCDCIGTIRKAYWTKDVNNIMNRNQNKEISLEKFLALNGNVDFDQEGTSIDVTDQVQKSIIKYISVFGTKVIDFNPDVSPFKTLSEFIGNGAQNLLKVPNSENYKLVLFCQVNSERFTFDVHYSDKGLLTQNENNNAGLQQQFKKIGVETYFERNSSRLALTGVVSPISKQDFFDKIEQIPLFANLLRVETFFRDRQHDMKRRAGLSVPLVVSCVLKLCQLHFEFAQNILEDFIEGSKFQTTNQTPLTYKVNMQTLSKSNLLADVRTRILKAFKVMKESNPELLLPTVEWFELEISGGRIWQSCFNKEWRTHDDWIRVDNLLEPGVDFVLLKLQQHAQVAKLTNTTNHIYDCFSLYRNSDQSYQWRPCRIVRRELLQKQEGFKSGKEIDQQYFNYWIEFKHAKHEGRNMWFKRKSSDILFSKEYTRYHLKGFKRDTLDYLLKLYK